MPPRKDADKPRSLQLKLGPPAYAMVKHLAEMRQKTIAEIIREALEIYSIGITYAAEGKQLVWEDRKTGEKTIVLIPGFTAPPAHLIAEPHTSNRPQ